MKNLGITLLIKLIEGLFLVSYNLIFLICILGIIATVGKFTPTIELLMSYLK